MISLEYGAWLMCKTIFWLVLCILMIDVALNFTIKTFNRIIATHRIRKKLNVSVDELQRILINSLKKEED